MLALLLLAALQDPVYDTVTLEAGRRADKIVAQDLNGDTFPDLLIQDGRDLHLFLFEKGRGFAPKSQQTLRLEGHVFLWTLGKLDGPALFTAGSRGLQTHAFDGRAFAVRGADLAVHPSVFQGTSSDTKPPPFVEFAPDLDGDGRSEALLFLPHETLVMRRDAGGDFRCAQKLPIPADAATVLNWGPHQKMTETLSVPILAFGDMNGDGRADVSFYRDESIGIFTQDASGRFAPAENLGITADKRRRNPRYFKFEFPPHVADFNADGILDLAVIYPSKGRVQIYYGSKGRRDYMQPDDLMQSADGWSTGIYLEDLDGDKRIDLVMGVVRKFGISEGIQVFLSGKVDLQLHVYPMQASGRFSKDPVQELRFSIPFSFHLTRDSGSLDLVFRPNFKGDFNRDGLHDLLVAEDEKTLRIYPGVKGKGLSDQPAGTISMSPPAGVTMTHPYVADFNQDGVSDLVLTHVLAGSDRRVLELKLSR